MIDPGTLKWMLEQTDEKLVDVLFSAGRIPYSEKAYWLELMPALRAARPEAQRTNGWIPCSEKLPANTDHVLVAYMPALRAPAGRSVQRRHWSITVCRYSGGAWRFVIPSQKSRLSKRVKFWQEIPDEPSPPMNSGRKE